MAACACDWKHTQSFQQRHCIVQGQTLGPYVFPRLDQHVLMQIVQVKTAIGAHLVPEDGSRDRFRSVGSGDFFYERGSRPMHLCQIAAVLLRWGVCSFRASVLLARIGRMQVVHLVSNASGCLLDAPLFLP